MRDAIQQQFGAALDALEGCIRACPADVWEVGERGKQPWYLAFHALFWTDLYLGESSADYAPPPPFTRGELERGVFPERAYATGELLGYVDVCRRHLAARLDTLDDAAERSCSLHWGRMNAVELLLYNLRHLQHHVAQLNLLIRQAGGEPAPWVMRADGLG